MALSLSGRFFVDYDPPIQYKAVRIDFFPPRFPVDREVFVMNVKRFRSALCLSFILTAICSTAYATDLVLNNVLAKVYFSPKGGCTQAIVDEIDNAKTEILVQAYAFTSVPITTALLEAHKRGVKVEVIMDRGASERQYTSATFLANQKIPTYVDGNYAVAHNKIIIVDGTTVITGSFNFTKAAEEENAENLLIISSEELAKLYTDNWNAHRQHSGTLEPVD